MLAALEMWAQRDHQKEDEMWTQWMQTIADRVTKIDGVTAQVRQPRGINNHSPGLTINWDPARLGITGEELSNILWTTEPRVALGGAGGGGGIMVRSCTAATKVRKSAFRSSGRPSTCGAVAGFSATRPAHGVTKNAFTLGMKPFATA